MGKGRHLFEITLPIFTILWIMLQRPMGKGRHISFTISQCLVLCTHSICEGESKASKAHHKWIQTVLMTICVALFRGNVVTNIFSYYLSKEYIYIFKEEKIFTSQWAYLMHKYTSQRNKYSKGRMYIFTEIIYFRVTY